MLKEKDFIEIEYTGILKSNNVVFDTTDENLAKKAQIHNPNMKYGPLKICLGEHHIIKGLDEQIIGKDIGNYTFEIPTEKAFGKKDPKLIMLMPLSKFKKENLNPFPGMQINVDNQLATVKRVNGGRVLVDFNHPLAGQDVIYQVKINKKIEDTKEKVQTEILMLFNQNIDFELNSDKLTINLELPEDLQKTIKEKIKEVIPEIKEVNFSKKENKKDKK